MKRLSSFTAAELAGAALAIVSEAGEIESTGIAHKVAGRLGSSTQDAEALGVKSMKHHLEVLAAMNRFSSRVRVQLDKLAAQGVIVKVGAWETLPTGYGSGNRARYYTHPVYDAAVQKHSDELKTKIAMHNRWNAISQRLSDGPGVALTRQHQLSLEHWEQLLDRGGW